MKSQFAESWCDYEEKAAKGFHVWRYWIVVFCNNLPISMNPFIILSDMLIFKMDGSPLPYLKENYDIYTSCKW